ncbi:MAG: hypothetical protein AAGG11_24090 [Pseudomonadota bacterium]
MDSPQHWTLIAFSLGLAGGVYGLFAAFASVTSDDTTQRVRSWVNSGQRKPEDWGDAITILFDQLFGSVLSIRFVVVSTIISIITFSLVSTALASYSVGELTVAYQPDGGTSVVATLIGTFISAAMANAIPDYLSTMETRAVLGHMNNRGSLLRFLAVDTVFTSAVVMAWLFILFISVRGAIISLPDMADFVIASFNPEHRSFVGIPALIITTYTTSIWVWLYLVGSWFLRVSRRLRVLLRFDERPIESIGFVSALLVTVLFWVSMAL